MKIEKVINNNIVSSLDKDGCEVIIMGRGLGFKKKTGQEIDESLIEKKFKMEDKKSSEQLKLILSEVPLEHIQITNEIIAYAKRALGVELNKNIYITLTDHIDFAIQRNSRETFYRNALLWEIKKFYPNEYSVGQHALELITERLNVKLPEDEAGSIALHIVNAEFQTSMDKAMDITKMIHSILNIVKYHFNINLDENTIHFERFITHLKFFAQRLFTGKMLMNQENQFFDIVKQQYREDYQCSEKIKEFIEKEYGYILSDEEMVYITIHIGRVTRNFDNN